MGYIEYDKGDKIIDFGSLVEEDIAKMSDDGTILIDVNNLKLYQSDLYEELINNSQYFIYVLKRRVGERKLYKFKLINFDDVTTISHIRKDDISKIVRVTGMITKATKVIAIEKEKKIQCNSCATSFSSNIKDFCPSCRSRNLTVKEQILQDIQEIEIEEPQDEIGDKQPQKIRVRLFDELTDKNFSGIIQPGNKVSIIGIVEKIPIYKKKNDEEIFEYRVNAVNIDSLEEKHKEDRISEEDMNLIFEISENNPLKILANSLSPSIFGHEEIKETLILQMVGGVRKEKRGGTFSRGNIHILLCGDPGLGKSVIAKNVNMRMPKSYYVSGDETSKAGLVAIVDRDGLTNEWSLKIGALGKANNSICIIDEMDKLSDEDRNALHTPMESGQIIVNKADIHATLQANCSILGIANPKEGIFDLSGDKTLTNQINLPPPLMSRFDIIFVMVDKIDQENDFSIVDIICSKEDKCEEIPIDLFRKYISYARELKPRLNKEKMNILSEFYSKLRKMSVGKSMRGMPITPRHAEGIIRLAEASAKIRLSNEVDEKDINKAIEIFYNSLLKLGLDEETGVLDMSRISSKIPVSKRGKVESVLNIFYQLSERIGNIIPYHELILETQKLKINQFDLNLSIEQLKKEQYIYEPRRGEFSLTEKYLK